MKSFRETLTLTMPDRMALVNITPEVEAAVRASGVSEGLALVNAMHLRYNVRGLPLLEDALPAEGGAPLLVGHRGAARVAAKGARALARPRQRPAERLLGGTR